MKNLVKHSRRTKAQIRTILRQEQKRNISIVEFCKIHKIHKATFYSWRNKYASKIEKPGEFIPVQFNDTGSEPPLFAEIELASNILVRLFHKVDASYFKALL